MYLEKMYVFQVKSRFFIIRLVKDCSKIVLCMHDKAIPTMFQPEKKLQVKKRKKQFFIILHIFQNPVLGVKAKFFPFFSETVRPIELKFFLQILRPNWGAYFFFFLSNLVSISFGRFYKIHKFLKFKVFDMLSICILFF